MKFILTLALAGGLFISGCVNETTPDPVTPNDGNKTEVIPSGDNKPVAPETYNYGNSGKSDPQLPKQTPWWKGN